MHQIRTALCLAALLIAAFAFPAQAKRADAGYFTAEMPAGWKMESENSSVGFYAPRNGGCLNVFIWTAEGLTRESAKKEAAERANGSAVKPLGAGYIYADGSGGRAWVVTDKDFFCEFATDKPIKNLAAFMATFKADDTPGVKRFLAEANKPEVLAWLSFESDAMAGGPAAEKNGAGKQDADDESFVDTGDFSVTKPKDWLFRMEEGVAAFRAPEDAHSIMVFVTKHENAKLDAIIKEQAGEGTEVRKLPGGRSYIYEDASGARVWGMLAKDGQFCEITVDSRFGGTAAFLASMKPGDGAPGMKEIISAAGSPETAAWLDFAPAGKAAAPAKEKKDGAKAPAAKASRTFKGNGLTAEVPAGWSTKIEKNMVTFMADDSSAGLLASVMQLSSDNHKNFVEFSKKSAKTLGGTKIRAAEGMVEFSTKDATGVFSQYGKKALLLMFFGNSAKQQDLAASVVPD